MAALAPADGYLGGPPLGGDLGGGLGGHAAGAGPSTPADRWFARGMAWVAGFHREEAAFCFAQAVAVDPTHAMAHWGRALAHGPDYNFSAQSGFYDLACAQPSGYPSLKVAAAAAAAARALVRAPGWSGPPAHRALVEAMAGRYPTAWPATAAAATALQAPYAAAMRGVSDAHPQDPEVQAAFAEAVMCLSPWKLYGEGEDASQKAQATAVPNAHGRDVALALGRGLSACPRHLWLCHLKVHLCEMGPKDKFDWDACEALRAGAAGLGHLLHMPTHLDIQAGHYAAGVRWNRAAFEADLRLWQHTGGQRFFVYMGYLIHNLEFMAWSAMYAADLGSARYAVGHIDTFLGEAFLRSHARAPLRFELYRATQIMVKIRFGLWDEILATPVMEDEALFLGHTLFLRYARGLAFGVQSRLAEARAEQTAFEALRARCGPEDRIKHNVNIVQMAEIAADILAAEIAYREDGGREGGGRQTYMDSAVFARLRSAVRLFDALPYDEPHGWLMSPRQTLGALLSEQGRCEEARATYREDLELFPNNIWSLRGLAVCATKMDGAVPEALEREIETARQAADIDVGASCACALESWGTGGSGGGGGSDGGGGACCGGKSKY